MYPGATCTAMQPSWPGRGARAGLDIHTRDMIDARHPQGAGPGAGPMRVRGCVWWGGALGGASPRAPPWAWVKAAAADPDAV